MSDKIAIIGNGESVYAFKAAGVDAFVAATADAARETLKRLAREYKVIFITDDLAAQIDDVIERMMENPYPIVVVLPAEGGSSEYAETKMKQRMERALGVDVLFGREEK